jgi:D-alanine-D-alanine ligase-like ATP-grasp enzyme
MHLITKSYLRSCESLGLQPLVRDEEMNGFTLRFGKHFYHFRYGLTPFNSVVSFSIASNKFSTNQLLANAGIPVPKVQACTLEEYREGKLDLDSIAFPVVAKPAWESACGTNVICNIQNSEELRNYFERYIRILKCIEIESYHPNLNSFRVLVFYNKVIGVVQRFPAHVIGDGKQSIQSLIKEQNQYRKSLKSKIPTGPITVNFETHKIIQSLGLTLKSIPKENELIPLRYICNATYGGTFKSLETSVICSENASLAVKAAQVLDLNLVGFDVICQDIGLPIEKSQGFFIEANADPDITIHELSFGGKDNKVSRTIVKKLISKHPFSYFLCLFKLRSPLGYILRLSTVMMVSLVMFMLLGA